jgi:hypothetical protein
MSEPVRKATVEDLRALGEDSRYELIHGEILEKSVSGVDHVDTVHYSSSMITRRFDRKPRR